MRDDESWDPDPLKVGDRVLIRLRGECPGTLTHDGRCRPHFPGYDGRPGRVTFLHDCFVPGPDGHRYVVLCNDPMGESRYARIELERLTWPS